MIFFKGILCTFPPLLPSRSHVGSHQTVTLCTDAAAAMGVTAGAEEEGLSRAPALTVLQQRLSPGARSFGAGFVPVPASP